MRTDAIDLNIFGTAIRVICEDPESMSRLRAAMAAHVSDTPAPVAFVLQQPSGSVSRLHVLLDRSGLVLARSRSADECLGALAEHLCAFVPAPAKTTRMKVRALLNEQDEAVLVPFPILASPPVVERRLARSGHRIIDRLAIDVNLAGEVEMTPRMTGLASLPLPPGHATAPARAKISAALVGGESASMAQLTWAFATAAGFPGRSRRLSMSLAKRLAHVRQIPVDLTRSASVYDQLASGRVVHRTQR